MNRVKVNNDNFYQRVMQEGSLGLGESYMNKEWDSEFVDMVFFEIKHEKLDSKFSFSPWFYFQYFFKSLTSYIWNFQSPLKSVEVAEKHYNLSNEMFEGMLDNRMIYSCGYWKNANNLEEAQENKLDLICRKVKLHPKGQGKKKKMIDIGCGWGGFVNFAEERYNVEAEGITISKEQFEYAVEKHPTRKYAMMDYRQLLSPEFKGKYDAVVSIGMFEHVGPQNYLTFLKICQHIVKDDGIILIHTIGGLKSKKIGDPWIDKYIFPNSVLPTLSQVTSEVEKTDLVVEDVHNFSEYYDYTLMSWYHNFVQWYKDKSSASSEKNSSEFKENDTFYRMWTYYLLQCAGLFRARDLQLYQFVLSKGLIGGYESVR